MIPRPWNCPSGLVRSFFFPGLVFGMRNRAPILVMKSLGKNRCTPTMECIRCFDFFDVPPRPTGQLYLSVFIFIYIGLASVGSDTGKHCNHCLSAKQPGYRFCFLVVAMAGGRVGSFARGGRALALHRGNERITWCVYGKAPTSRIRGMPIAVSGSGHTRKQVNYVDVVIRM